jgi:hypothetical protein
MKTINNMPAIMPTMMPTMMPAKKVAPAADSIIDDEGRCPCHTFVQLSRRSSRTGEWMSLLDGCPLCAMDGKSTAGSVCSQQFNGQEDENPSSNTTAATKERRRGRNPRQLSSSLPPRRTRNRSSSCGSRVRFQPDKDVQFTTTDSVHVLNCEQPDKEVRSVSMTAVTKTKSALRASPRYKVCEVLMQQQLDESEKITTMSMDMSLDFSTHDDEDSGISLNHTHNEERHDGQMDRHEEDEEQQVEDEKEDEKMQLPLPLLPSLLPPSLPHGSENESKETSTRNQDDQESESTDGCQRGSGRGRRSYQQVQAVQLRPEPNEPLPGNIGGYSSQTSSSQRQRGRREVGVGGEQRRSRSASLSYQTQRLKLPPPQLTNSMQLLQPSPEGSARNNQYLNHRQQQQRLYTNMVISPEPNDDEVSTLSFMGHSVCSTSDYPNYNPASICENSSQERDENGPCSSSAQVAADNAKSVSALSLSMIRADTNEVDPKTGRCIHHPHIRLRKKKLFGKGWKVLMSACPDCCVDELRRLRSAEENNLKLASDKKNKIESLGRRVSDLTDDSGYGNNGSAACSRVSIHMGRVDEGETLTSRRRSSSRSSGFRVSDLTGDSGNGDNRGGFSADGGTSATKRRSRSFSRSCSDCLSGPTSFFTSPKTMTTSLSPTKVELPLPPPPPPRRSPSQDIRRGPQPLPPKKGTLHLESDEATASLTCSDGSSISNHSNTKKKEDNIGDASNRQEQEVDELSQSQQENLHATLPRQMRWTDPKTGQSGTYTGQVNDRYVPHGCGTMEYDPNPNNDMSGLGVSTVLVKDGEWKDGRFRRNRHRSRGSSVNINAKRSSEGDSGDRLRSSSVRSRSTGRRHSSDISGQSQQRQRSLSRSARQVSF